MDINWDFDWDEDPERNESDFVTKKQMDHYANRHYGIDAESELLKIFAEEIDKEIMKHIFGLGENKF